MNRKSLPAPFDLLPVKIFFFLNLNKVICLIRFGSAKIELNYRFQNKFSNKCLLR